MTIKAQILKVMEENKGIYFSGEELAERLNVSRTAVWKAVNTLRAEGYDIDAVKNKGYCLSVASDILSEQGIAKYLTEDMPFPIQVYPVVSSTNTMLREQAAAGAPEGTVVLAAAQTAGRGRIGRQFVSPSETGIYLSLLLRPEEFSPAEATAITTMAAVAVCRAIESVSGRSAGIKWVNDIFMDGKKVCGILTEGAFGMETGLLEYVVLGVGINVYPPREGFPEELQQIAGSIFTQPVSDGKNRLTAEFLKQFWAIYKSPASGYAQEYRSRSLVIGREITVISARGTAPAVALDVDDCCRLRVRYPDGTQELLSTGEISIKMI